MDAPGFSDPRRHLPCAHHLGLLTRRARRGVRGGLLPQGPAPAARGACLAFDGPWARRVARVRAAASLARAAHTGWRHAKITAARPRAVSTAGGGNTRNTSTVAMTLPNAGPITKPMFAGR